MVNRFNFRVYIKPLNKVYKVKNLFIENKGIEPVDENGSSVSVDGLTNQFYEEEYILMQSTGLEDGNGKEIFESDILEDKEFEKYFIKYSDTLKRFTICAVDWSDEEDYCGDCDWDEYIRENFEKYKPVIIGNIYENKELLKK